MRTVSARWCGDITYVPTGEGWLYPASDLGLVSRRRRLGHRGPPADRTGRRRCASYGYGCSPLSSASPWAWPGPGI
ncbi:hypothetical protein O1L44_05455 [Streptomyces noursei]|nr:hypothetical protein [Streptomyces noursei]